MFAIGTVAKAVGIEKPALLNYVHRGIAIHCGVSPANGSPRDVPLLGVYELSFIAALGRSGIGPAVAAPLFQRVMQAAPSAIYDRNYGDPLFAVITLDRTLLEHDPPSVIVIRGSRAADFATIVSILVNLSALFGRADRALHRECRNQRKDEP